MSGLEDAFALAARLERVGLHIEAELVRHVDPSRETLRAVEALVDELERARPALALASTLLARADDTGEIGEDDGRSVLAAVNAALGEQ